MTIPSTNIHGGVRRAAPRRAMVRDQGVEGREGRRRLDDAVCPAAVAERADI